MARRRRYRSSRSYHALDAEYGGYFFPPSRPLEARGGIKAQSRRGAFGESWWARRWVEVLESFDLGARLTRGRSYARRGQVTGIEIEAGSVGASVQGSRTRPYEVTLELKTLTAPRWKKIAQRIGREAIFAAKLLAGELPAGIEEVFQAAGASLFPTRSQDLKTACSCPDWSNPCKHIAAVYYLLAEEFDRDPFLLLRLRGVEREDLVEWIGRSPQPAQGKSPAVRKRAASASGRASRTRPTAQQERTPARPRQDAEPLPVDPAAFWGGAAAAGNITGAVPASGAVAALPRRLGSFPFWRGEEAFLETMDRIYRQSTTVGLEVLAGGHVAPPGDK